VFRFLRVFCVKTIRRGLLRAIKTRNSGVDSRRQEGRYNTFVELAIRNSGPKELDALWHIDQECFAPGIAYSRRELAAYLGYRGAFTLVAYPAGGQPSQILGFLIAIHREHAPGHIITIDVTQQARRHGVGSRLLAAAEERLRKLKCRSVYLETAVDNTSALAFYKRHQYFLIKTVPRYYSNGVDALVLQKDLLSAAQAS
jgi:[ribosomal protein S18]-alanine N-acetyltransferase